MSATCECDEQDDQVCAHAPDPCFAPHDAIIPADALAMTVACPICWTCLDVHIRELATHATTKDDYRQVVKLRRIAEGK